MPIFLFTVIGFFLFSFEALAANSSYWSEMVFYVRTQQQAFYRELASAIRALQEGGIQAMFGMVFLSFLYGIFHAVGPGHGKAIISTYLLSHESLLKRGISLSFASAFVQGLSAVILVDGMFGLLGLTRSEAKNAVPILEMFSFGLVAIIGLVLMKRALTAFIKRYRQNKRANLLFELSPHYGKDEGCFTCGHAHAPSVEILQRKTSWRDSIAIIFSVGIRPCSGSVLVLIFAEIVGFRWAGVGSIFAISLGTAITVSALAVLAVYFRRSALYIVEKQDRSYVQSLFLGAAFIGGLFITLFGSSLFLQASQSTHPLF